MYKIIIRMGSNLLCGEVQHKCMAVTQPLLFIKVSRDNNHSLTGIVDLIRWVQYSYFNKLSATFHLFQRQFPTFSFSNWNLQVIFDNTSIKRVVFCGCVCLKTRVSVFEFVYSCLVTEFTMGHQNEYWLLLVFPAGTHRISIRKETGVFGSIVNKLFSQCLLLG